MKMISQLPPPPKFKSEKKQSNSVMDIHKASSLSDGLRPLPAAYGSLGFAGGGSLHQAGDWRVGRSEQQSKPVRTVLPFLQ